METDPPLMTESLIPLPKLYEEKKIAATDNPNEPGNLIVTSAIFNEEEK